MGTATRAATWTPSPCSWSSSSPSLCSLCQGRHRNRESLRNKNSRECYQILTPQYSWLPVCLTLTVLTLKYQVLMVSTVLSLVRIGAHTRRMGTPGVMRMRSVSLGGATYLSVPSQLIFSTETLIMHPFIMKIVCSIVLIKFQV